MTFSFLFYKWVTTVLGLSPNIRDFSLSHRDMEDMASLWNFQENIEELKQKLLYATIELESARMEANEEMKKNKESIKQLLQLLKVAYQERDEARDQLQKILNKVMPSSPPEFLPLRPQLQPESPLIKPTKANSSITESNSLSETYNPQSHGSPPVDSFFDTVTSPDLSNITLADSSNMAFVNQPFVQEYNGSVPAGLVSSRTAKIDQASAVIDNLVKGKALPQKGNLLQAVMEAGPLLQTLLVAGPLPGGGTLPHCSPSKFHLFLSKGVTQQSTIRNSCKSEQFCSKTIELLIIC
ncbi:hypothetical protein CK203_070457 [Vitis vinifera]|uniref:Uncharacterized protein n=1 Tax=Vitis vinifera TaxID=29760 RepID=A0A438FAI1_VITVI|nr:hypothetical protein CK203_070457 [Vitis vinifera]